MSATFTTPAKDVRSMSFGELKELQHAWYCEARAAGVLAQIAEVARVLGDDVTERYGPKYRWLSPSRSVEVYVDDYGAYFTVTVDGKPVVSTHSTERLFVPGAWLDEISAAYPEAAAQRAARGSISEEMERLRLLVALTPFTIEPQGAP